MLYYCWKSVLFKRNTIWFGLELVFSAIESVSFLSEVHKKQRMPLLSLPPAAAARKTVRSHSIFFWLYSLFCSRFQFMGYTRCVIEISMLIYRDAETSLLYTIEWVYVWYSFNLTAYADFPWISLMWFRPTKRNLEHRLQFDGPFLMCFFVFCCSFKERPETFRVCRWYIESVKYLVYDSE